MKKELETLLTETLTNVRRDHPELVKSVKIQ